MKKLLTLLATVIIALSSSAQTKVTTSEMDALYKSESFSQISVHDPSVLYNPNDKMFYIFGSHYFGGKSSDLRNWTPIANYYNTTYDKAFKSNTARTVERCLPGSANKESVSFPSFDAAAFCSIYSSDEAGWVSGDQWAPDFIWNPVMNKWCYYVSLNGDHWASVVVLMTSDNVAGPYTYQGPVVFGGFDGQTHNGKKVDYKKTDLEIVLGTQASLPTRYITNKWGTYYPNPIDPCVFFDEEGELWLAYGSWSGGIFMLKLDKNTGLRDYTYTYSGTGTSPNATSDDAYFGHRIAGGYYVSGEGPYIQHIGNYYYLFMSYGGFAPDGGYEMRVFRSTSPQGPYKDASGNVATYTGYQLNYGPNAQTNKGMKLIGAMNGWGNMKVGECAQGHNSACVDDKGRSFLITHTKFNNGTLDHSVRAYQLYTNRQGWLCTAPFQFRGETTTDADIASTCPWSAADVAGDYHVLIHPYKLNHSSMAEATPIKLHLTADGRITGDKTGTWKFPEEGKSYIEITISGSVYSGVLVEQTLENNTAKTLCFTTVCCTSGNVNCGVPVWGYKLQPKYALAYNYLQNTSKLKGSIPLSVNKNVSIMFDPVENVALSWTSSNPEALSETGKCNPQTEATAVTMTARMECGDYYWENSYNTRVVAAAPISGDLYSSIAAYYNFDESPSYNLWDKSNQQKATLGRSGTSGTAAKYATDYDRFGKIVHTYFGAQGSNSYVRMQNPLKGIDESEFEGFTVGMWVKRSDANLWDDLWSFFGSTSSAASGPRLFFTGNTYLGFNNNAGDWFDVNHPDTKKVSSITVGEWKYVMVTFSKSAGYTLYVDGTKLYSPSFAGSTSSIDNFDKQKVLDFVRTADLFYLGLGSFWGSADVSYDDVLIYSRELSATDVKGVFTQLNRVNDFTPDNPITGINEVISDEPSSASNVRLGIYDLTGRKVDTPKRGIYIIDGKKVFVK